ncbi:Helix-turn-helix [Algoriphagus faecimaris]|uniref:Helix-turn-helix n=2 Tax=Algoriphagus faecimaris TaxID=686796 RepID=A0A1G6M4I5_9BACT|nr:Helix-turn-helix [Algoriphagus faecimaris]
MGDFKKTDMENSLQTQYRNLFQDMTEEDSIEIKASVLALQFLGLVDEKMKETGMKKKELADQIGTSVSYLTQLFRGDQKPSWEVLAKMSIVLGLEFRVTLGQ